jgi:tetratricopeptide (TPR) repeat protein
MTKSSQVGVVLTPEERLARRRLILRDAVSLFTLFLITAVIFVLTWLLHRSFTDHEALLGQRWEARGEAALKAGDPQAAIQSLRSALAYVPSPNTEVELATALAEAGRTQEAFAYFNTLRESAPGDGMINLQLARLAAKEGDEPLAIRRYRSALDGTWEGNGFEHRRDVRLELAGYLISRHEYSEARTQLLIAASNAPADDPSVQLQIADLLEQAQDLTDALKLYRSVADQSDAPLPAIEGAGQAAFNLGMYRVAAGYLSREMASPAAASLSASARAADQKMLNTANYVLMLFPGTDLPARARAQRILAAKDTARKRLKSCSASSATAPSGLATLTARWSQVPARVTVYRLEQQPDLEQTIIQLVYDTETVAAQVCGAPTGDDAVLLRIARNPGAVEKE